MMRLEQRAFLFVAFLRGLAAQCLPGHCVDDGTSLLQVGGLLKQGSGRTEAETKISDDTRQEEVSHMMSQPKTKSRLLSMNMLSKKRGTCVVQRCYLCSAALQDTAELCDSMTRDDADGTEAHGHYIRRRGVMQTERFASYTFVDPTVIDAIAQNKITGYTSLFDKNKRRMWQRCSLYKAFQNFQPAATEQPHVGGEYVKENDQPELDYNKFWKYHRKVTDQEPAWPKPIMQFTQKDFMQVPTAGWVVERFGKTAECVEHYPSNAEAVKPYRGSGLICGRKAKRFYHSEQDICKTCFCTPVP